MHIAAKLRVHVRLGGGLMHTLAVLFAVVRVGVIGLDTSHSVAFTKHLNVTREKPEYQDFRVVAAVVHGSRDIASSTNRYPSYTAQMREMGVQIVPDIATLLGKVDAVLLETNDGREHYAQTAEVFRAGKPCFIDKPLAHNLVDSVRIVDLAASTGAKFFTSSALRYVKAIRRVKAEKREIRGMDCWTCFNCEPTHERWYWYGIHCVDPLYAVMGMGCETVTSFSGADGEIAVGRWRDGRFGVARGLSTAKKGAPYGGMIFTTAGQVDMGTYEGYGEELAEILKFFKTGLAPVAPEESLEALAFMTAAAESSAAGGMPVKIADVLSRARMKAK